MMSPELALEMESLKLLSEQVCLPLGEQMASEIVGYLNPKEVHTGTAMVGVHDVSQEAVTVLDEFIGELKKQTNLGLPA